MALVLLLAVVGTMRPAITSPPIPAFTSVPRVRSHEAGAGVLTGVHTDMDGHRGHRHCLRLGHCRVDRIHV